MAVQERTYLTDAEARQSRVQVGQAIMRVTDLNLMVPARCTLKGVIWAVDGTRRRFENQAGNLIELNTEAAIRLKKEIRAARRSAEAEAESKGILDEDAVAAYADAQAVNFKFAVTMDDLDIRINSLFHAPYAQQRPSDFAPDPRYSNPIIGLDVDEKGQPIRVRTLVDDYEDHLTAVPAARAATAPTGFIPATGGAFAALVAAAEGSEDKDDEDSAES